MPKIKLKKADKRESRSITQNKAIREWMWLSQNSMYESVSLKEEYINGIFWLLFLFRFHWALGTYF